MEKASSKYHGMELKDDLILSLCLLRTLGTFMGEKNVTRRAKHGSNLMPAKLSTQF